MNKTIFLYIALFTLFSTSSICAQIDSETRNLDKFDQITVGMGIELDLVPGDENIAEIEVENIDLEDVVTKVDGRKLIVKIKGIDLNFKKQNRKNIKIQLTYQELEMISANSGSSVTSDHTITNTHLEINASSGATIDLTVDSDKLRVKATAGSEIELEGNCNSLSVVVGTGSEIDADRLESKIVEAKANTGSELRIWATDRLYAKANTGAEIKYKGDPEVQKKKGTGGTINKI